MRRVWGNGKNDQIISNDHFSILTPKFMMTFFSHRPFSVVFSLFLLSDCLTSSDLGYDISTCRPAPLLIFLTIDVYFTFAYKNFRFFLFVLSHVSNNTSLLL